MQLTLGAGWQRAAILREIHCRSGRLVAEGLQLGHKCRVGLQPRALLNDGLHAGRDAEQMLVRSVVVLLQFAVELVVVGAAAAVFVAAGHQAVGRLELHEAARQQRWRVVLVARLRRTRQIRRVRVHVRVVREMHRGDRVQLLVRAEAGRREQLLLLVAAAAVRILTQQSRGRHLKARRARQQQRLRAPERRARAVVVSGGSERVLWNKHRRGEVPACPRDSRVMRHVHRHGHWHGHWHRHRRVDPERHAALRVVHPSERHARVRHARCRHGAGRHSALKYRLVRERMRRTVRLRHVGAGGWEHFARVEIFGIILNL